MQLAIFDIDGTLTNTNTVDALCFVRALAEEMGIVATESDWAAVTHVTDAAITEGIFRRSVGRLPSQEELARLQDRLVSLLGDCRRRTPEAFAQVQGAGAAVQRLRSDPGWAVAIASGCWCLSGMMKLHAAEIDFEGIPAAFAEDGVTREDILATAVARACRGYGQGSFSRVVSVGDGVWDLQAARGLGLSFLGVRCDGLVEALQRHGASHVLRDFSDFGLVLRALEAARVPA